MLGLVQFGIDNSESVISWLGNFLVDNKYYTLVAAGLVFLDYEERQFQTIERKLENVLKQEDRNRSLFFCPQAYGTYGTFPLVLGAHLATV